MSTITVHLRLNYDTNAALTQIQAKVAQVRNDLPPESEAPIIELETADSEFAAMYIGFSSEDLDENQITDYLTRVVQPRLSSIAGVQRADILGGRTFAMRVWLKPDMMAARGISPSDVRNALARNNYLSALGTHQGIHGVGEPGGQHRPQDGGGVPATGGQGGRRQPSCAWATSPTWCWGPRTTSRRFASTAMTATFIGIWVLPTAELARSHPPRA